MPTEVIMKPMKIGEIAEMGNEKVDPGKHPEEKFELYSIPSYHATGLPETRKGREIKSLKSIVHPGDVLYSRLNPHVPKVWLVGNQGRFTQIASIEFFVLRPREGILNRYLHHLLLSPDLQSRAVHVARGTTPSRRRVPIRAFMGFSIPIPTINGTPSYKLQQTAADFIDSVVERSYAARQNLSRIPELTKRLRTTILSKAFRGELTDRNLDDTPVSATLKRIGEKRRAPSRTGEPKAAEEETPDWLPAGWIWSSMDELSEHVVDCPHSTPDFERTGKYCVDTTCIEPGRILFDKARRVSESTFFQRIQRLKPQHGDIVFAREATVGTAACVPEDVDICLGQRVMMFRPWQEIVPQYVMWGLNSPIMRNQIEPLLVGTTVHHLNVADAKKLAIPVAPYEEQTRIVSKIEGILGLCDDLERQTQKAQLHLSFLQQAILAKAFRGELLTADYHLLDKTR